ncbi:membrane fusion protein (multidrug efflux system) [Rhodoligotrophos appendicifer]|uniref:HlyD family secretion protein n=1 Tax=Rhodoligotrophos appendicifer TaxID=987056 RepID=UPI0011862893|nr:HlyD family secretion protein [Rhodoligotrophos appendicifer]
MLKERIDTDQGPPGGLAPVEGRGAEAAKEEAEPTPSSPAVPAKEEVAPPKRRLRAFLLILGPLVVVIGGLYFFLTGGRYVSTDNAYLKADKVMIAPEVSGRVAAVYVHENEDVTTGKVLFHVDDLPYRIALNKAEAQLRITRTEIEALKASYGQKQQQLKAAQEEVIFAQHDYDRQSELTKSRVVSQATLEQSERNLRVAQDNVLAIKKDLDQVEAQLGGDVNLPVEKQPRYLLAVAERDAAALDLKRTDVVAPFNGIIGQKPEIGDFASAGEAVTSIVADEELWIEANFKETDLTNVRPGQKVEIDVDTYPDTAWTGTVLSIAQASGAEFSVIPPQNATGNWVKVVQRIPVRIKVEAAANDPQLRAGMSASVEIDTKVSRSLSDLMKPVLAWFGDPTSTTAHAEPSK